MKKKKKTFKEKFRSFTKDKKGIIPCLIVVFIATFLAYLIIMIFPSMGSFLGQKDGEADATEPPTWSGTSDTVAELDGLKMPDTEGKLGHEDHLFPPNRGRIGDTVSGDPQVNACVDNQIHYIGDDAKKGGKIITAGGCGAFGAGMTTDQERWYFNMRWNYGGRGNDYRHKKIIITNPKNGKRIVVSLEEYGPAEFVIRTHGINSGAPTEVYTYLMTENPYTKDPNDKKGWVMFGFAEDQNIPLGPLPDITPITKNTFPLEYSHLAFEKIKGDL